MIQMQTLLDVADNSGAKKVRCIKVLNGSKRRYARVGDLIQVSVQSANPSSKINAGDKSLAVVVRTKAGVRRGDGAAIRFDENAVALLNNQKQPVGTRVFGPVTRELRQFFMKIVSLAPEVI